MVVHWSAYNDAAIVVFPEQHRHYLVVILTEGIGSAVPTPIIQLGQAIEAAVLSSS